MALTTLPGTNVRLDPDQITKIDICCADTARVEIRIFLRDNSPHHFFEFPDKAAAVDFYRAVWQLRSGERLGDREIESFLLNEGTELA
ncbi:hypothetical protein FRZ44_28250 [Hypericibacter terrae]|jgi:hypothetical protein|uniref:Uncharacterized protein n=1 Tax=Hypericibacter terrae TaxID=2602015 RepID=A0A5J6MLZ0_9PROT|nr:hypothetical protein [Hypericibacter terrae]QEX17525.1 hypothetical protein FRZ44_28250 [Hypericibacter terrae]